MEAVPVTRVHDEDDPQSWTWSVPVRIAAARGGPWQEVAMCVDTGTLRSQLVDQAVQEPAEDAEPAEDGYVESRGVLGSGRSRRVRLDGLEIGGLSVHDLEVDLVPPDQPGARALLGLDVLGMRSFAFSP